MTSERIKEIQQQTAYPDSVSVQQALLQVWNECSQLPQQQTFVSKGSDDTLKDYHIVDTNEMVFPKDINGVIVKVGDKVQGIGSLRFQDGFKIDRTPIVTVNIQNGKLYFGNLSAESFTLGFKILELPKQDVDKLGNEDVPKLGYDIEKLAEDTYESSQQEISDEEIEKEMLNRYMTPIQDYAWKEACKWYREQLKQTKDTI